MIMEEIGVVTRTEGRFATVTVEKSKGICENCTMGTCHVAGQGTEIEALNTVGAKEGQKVKVILKPYSYIKGSFIVYVVPVLFLILGAVAGKEYFSRYFPAADPENISAAFAFGAFFASFLLIKLWSRKAEKKFEYKPFIEEILD